MPRSKDTLAPLVMKIFFGKYSDHFKDVMVFCKQWGHYSQNNFGPKSKDTLAPLVMKILKQCFW